MAGLGFLIPEARADLIEDALECLRQRAAGVEERSDLLRQADSLGFEIEVIRRTGREAPAPLLRQADRLQSETLDRDVDLLTLAAHCRALARGAAELCAVEIASLESALAAGRGSTADAERLLTLKADRAILETAVAGTVVAEYPMIPADSSDTQEVLRAKLQYYQDVRTYLTGLEERVSERLIRVADERRALVEAIQLLEDMSFLDEGGRVSAGGTARLRQGVPGQGTPGEGTGRVASTTDVGGGLAGLTDFLEAAPRTPEESDQLIEVLKGYRQEIQRKLESLSDEAKKIESRLLPEVPAPR